MNTQHKRAVITGANSGIGLALTQKLLNEGYLVTGTSRSGSIAELDHPNLRVVQLDINNQQSIDKAVEQIKNIAGGIDILVNNAGIAPDVMEITPNADAFTATFATNVNGTVFFTEPLLEQLNEAARVIFISSAMGLPKNAAANGPAYRMSKAAVNMYAAILAQRLTDKNIIVTPVHPGWVQTRLGGDSAPFTTEQSAEGIFKAITADTTSGKFWNIEVDAVTEY